MKAPFKTGNISDPGKTKRSSSRSFFVNCTIVCAPLGLQTMQKQFFKTSLLAKQKCYKRKYFQLVIVMEKVSSIPTRCLKHVQEKDLMPAASSHDFRNKTYQSKPISTFDSLFHVTKQVTRKIT